MRSHLFAATLCLLSAVALPAAAHPKLVEASPSDGAKVGAPAKVTLKFNEKLMPRFTGAELMMTGMPGMAAHAPAKIAATAKVEGPALTLTPAKPLAAGSYRVDWHAVAADTHRVKGSISFTAQ